MTPNNALELTVMHRRTIMHRSVLPAVFALVGAYACADVSHRGASPKIVASESCREFFSIRASPGYPAAAMNDHISGYSIATYSLDGSGKAHDIRIVASEPWGVFDAAATSALERSSFKIGATANECRYVADFAAVKRSAP